MMKEESSAEIVAVIRNEGEISWYRSDRELWILDYKKWTHDFISHGHQVPVSNNKERGGIPIVNSESKDKFLEYIAKFEVSKDDLSKELAQRYVTAKSWWDVGDLFPIIFVDFDSQHVGAFYPWGAAMERYIPDEWTGEFIDFANEYPEDIFPQAEKFWIKGDSDLLKLLIERGAGS